MSASSFPTLIAVCVAAVCLVVGFLIGYSTGGMESTLCSSGPVEVERAICVFDEKAVVNGYLTFTQVTSGNISIFGNLTNIEGTHAMHIHEYGSLEDSCRGAGRHFNPLDNVHGAPHAAQRHVGDLGNINFENMTAVIDFSDHQASLNGPNSIIGRSVVIHQRQDDLGLGSHQVSKETGNAGGRLACCVIAIERMRNSK